RFVIGHKWHRCHLTSRTLSSHIRRRDPERRPDQLLCLVSVWRGSFRWQWTRFFAWLLRLSPSSSRWCPARSKLRFEVSRWPRKLWAARHFSTPPKRSNLQEPTSRRIAFSFSLDSMVLNVARFYS